jgi:hypothetical protein
MKRHLISTFILLLIAKLSLSQIPPNAFNYSAVARNVAGAPIASTTIGIQISILKTSTVGPIQYVENHFVNTDAYGLFNLVIGAGAVQTGSMKNIKWNNDNYYLKVGMDATGGTSFLTMGITQLLSVPYAIHAKTADSITGSVIKETDPVFNKSTAKNITSADSIRWSNKQNKLIAGKGITFRSDTILSNAASSSHYIGEYFGGGVIFHLWKDSLNVEHGLIVAIKDQSDSMEWSNINNVEIGKTAQSLWDGLSNSNAIVAQSGHINSAAKLCLDLVSGGKSDWYLPSINEFFMLRNNLFHVNMTLSKIKDAVELFNITANHDWQYWTSTEYRISGNIFAYPFDFTNTSEQNWKGNAHKVRAIRAF